MTNDKHQCQTHAHSANNIANNKLADAVAVHYSSLTFKAAMDHIYKAYVSSEHQQDVLRSMRLKQASTAVGIDVECVPNTRPSGNGESAMADMLDLQRIIEEREYDSQRGGSQRSLERQMANVSVDSVYTRKDNRH